MINIDGSHDEGGGQIVRTALALSTLTGQPFRITNIRKTREKPGLKAQHTSCIKALQQICNAKVDGEHIGSTELLYIPSEINAKNLDINIGTAGSITLLLQAILLPCIFANKKQTITITGGTDVAWSMQIDYFNNVVLPHYKRYSDIELSIQKRGYYPTGNGKVTLTIKPIIKRKNYTTLQEFLTAVQLTTIQQTEQGHIISIKGISHASENQAKQQTAERQANSAKQQLAQLNVPIHITTEYQNTISTGAGITLWAICSKDKDDIDPSNPIRIGTDALANNETPEQTGIKAAQQLLQEINSGAPIDKHLADNMVPLIALSAPSAIKTSQITPHTRTNIHITQKFLPVEFKIQDNLIITEIKTNTTKTQA